MVEDVTYTEWAEALQNLTAEHGDCDGFKSVRDLIQELGIGERRIHRILQEFGKQGLLVIKEREQINIRKRKTYIPVYRILKKKGKK
jgi:hypothetical protein